MTMNSRWRSLFFNFTNAPATGFPDASCTRPSTVELFSAAQANWLQRNSKTAAKMTVNLDRVRLDVISDLLIFSLTVLGRRACNQCPTRPPVQQETFYMCVGTRLFAEYTPIPFQRTQDF